MMAAMGRKAGDMTLDKWQRMTEWFMTALALVFLFAYSWEVLARTHIVLCETVINIIWMAFIVDYVASFLLAKDKKAWLKETCSTVPVAWRCVDVSHCTHAAA